MKRNIILKQDPKVEFQFQENGFQLVDGMTNSNNGFFNYRELESVSLHKAWYPKFAKFMRLFTWLMNGVPFFPDGESYIKAQFIIQLEKNKIGFWLTDSKMTYQAKRIKAVLRDNLEN